ncbi:type III effector HrpK domain-containing protein [Thauera sinica]|uniref:Type III effector HrpK domain-containing protein n=1 Tax=Thauera sinica TaxID=2665146 RepID=A0ABW1AQ82_9RHOO|nr:type III effector HrpK domain-containing protein [Thauera sp. K11]
MDLSAGLGLGKYDAENLIINGSFEANRTDDGTLTLLGWTSDSGQIEVWNGFGTAASDGKSLVELDAGLALDNLKQTVYTQAGQTYTLSFDLSQRDFWGSSKDGVEVWWNGVPLGKAVPATTAWQRFEFTVTGTGKAGGDELKLQESTAENNGLSSLLDNVSLVVARNLIVNGSFESNSAYAGDLAFLGNNDVPGWTSDSGVIEVWKNFGVAASDGYSLIELDASMGIDNLKQTVHTQAGRTYRLSFDLSQRNFAGSSKDGVEVWWNGALLGKAVPDKAAWQRFEFIVTGTGKAGGDELKLQESATENNGISSFLDNVTPGDDILIGTPGSDLINGGEGTDLLSGKGGDDIYVFDSVTGKEWIAMDSPSNQRGDVLEFSAASGITLDSVRLQKGHASTHSGAWLEIRIMDAQGSFDTNMVVLEGFFESPIREVRFADGHTLSAADLFSMAGVAPIPSVSGRFKRYDDDGKLTDISLETGFLTNERYQTLMGYLDTPLKDGDRVMLSVNGRDWIEADVIPEFAGVGDKPAFVATVPLKSYANQILVLGVNADGVAGETVAIPYTLDATAPAKPEVAWLVFYHDYPAPQGYTTLFISGATEAGTTIKVYGNTTIVPGSTASFDHLLASTVPWRDDPNEEGVNWLIQALVPAGQGNLAISVLAVDAAGNVSQRTVLDLAGAARTGVDSNSRWQPLMNIMLKDYNDNRPIPDEMKYDIVAGLLNGTLSSADVDEIRLSRVSPVTKAFINQTVQLMGYMSMQNYNAGDIWKEWDRQKLLDVASSSSSWSVEASAGALMWSNVGMFDILDKYGDDLGKTPHGNGKIDRDDILGWGSAELAPTTTRETIELLNAAAISSVMQKAGGVEGLTDDILAHPENYTGAQKAALFFHLYEIQSGILALYKTGTWERVLHLTEGFANKPAGHLVALRSAMDILTSDQGTRDYIDEHYAEELRNLVHGDLYVELSRHLETLESPGHITSMLDGAGNMGKTLLEWSAEIKQVRDMLFRPDEPMGALSALLGGAGLYESVMQYYIDEIVTANFLRRRVNEGADLETAIAEMGAETAGLLAVLDSASVNAYTPQARDNLAITVNELLIGQLDQQVLDTILLTPDGRIDYDKLGDLYDQLAIYNPDLLNSGGTKLKQDDIFKVIQTAWDLAGRSPQKFGSAITKWFKDVLQEPVPHLPSAFQPSEVYSKGAMHVAAAMLGGLSLALKGATGLTDPKKWAVDGTKVASLIFEGSASWGKGLQASGDFVKLGKVGWERIGAAAKGLGGLAGVVGGVFGIIDGVQSLHLDPVGSGFKITSSVLGLVSGLSSVVEASAAIIGSFSFVVAGSTAAMAATAVATVASIVGTVFGVAGGVLAVGGNLASIIMELINRNKQEAADRANTGYLKYLMDEMGAYGLSTGQTATLEASTGDLFMNAGEQEISLKLRIKTDGFYRAGDYVVLVPKPVYYFGPYDRYFYADGSGLVPVGGELPVINPATIYAQHKITESEAKSGIVVLTIPRGFAGMGEGTLSLTAQVFSGAEIDRNDKPNTDVTIDWLSYTSYAMSNEVKLVMDFTAPSTPVVTQKQVSGAAQSDGKVEPGKISAEGTGEAGSIIHLMHGETLIAKTTVGSDGRWAFSPTALSAREYSGSIYVVAVDAAGNLSEKVSLPGAGRQDLLVDGNPQPGSDTTTGTILTVKGKIYDLVIDAYQFEVNGSDGIEMYWNGARVADFVPVKLDADGERSSLQRFVVSVIGTGGTDQLQAKTPAGMDGKANARIESISAYESWGVTQLAGDSGDNVLFGNDGPNMLYGFDGNDTLDGVSGSDLLVGGAGDDTYIAGMGGGRTLIVERHQAGQPEHDVLRLEGVDAADISEVWFSKVGTDLQISFYDREDTITIDGWYASPANRVETISAGTFSISSDNVIRLAGAMAAYDLPSEQDSDAAAKIRSALDDAYRAFWALPQTQALNSWKVGTDGSDTLTGGAGADRLNGKLGNDTLTGGGGADTFIFDTALGSNNVDTIADFNMAEKDSIVLDSAIFTRLALGKLSGFNFRLASAAPNGGDDYIVFDHESKSLYYNEQGGAGNGVLFAQIPNLSSAYVGAFNPSNVDFRVI